MPPSQPPPGQLPPVPFPPPMYPPAMYPPAMMPRQGGGFARAIFTTLAVSVLGISITLNIYLLLTSALLSADASAMVRSDVIVAGDATNVIAVVPVAGIIDDQAVQNLRVALDHLYNDTTIKAVILEVDSPGGTVTASDEMYDQLIKLKQDKRIPLIVSMRGLACSGGYYIACAGDHIVAQRTTWTGNIGVLMPRISLAKFGEKWGIEDQTIASTGSDFKDAGSMLRDDTPEQLAYWQRLTDQAFDVFKDVVATGRQMKPEVVDQVANGKVYMGPEAMQLKLVDSIGYLEDAIAVAAQKAGVTGPQVVRIDRQPSFWESLSASSAQSNAVQMKIGQQNVGIDRSTIDDMLAPRPMYLYRGN